MTITTDDPAPGPAPEPPAPDPVLDPPRTSLTRSRDSSLIAGVCGGLGRYTGVDPVVFRVLFPVLVVFGGAGLLLYALGWLLIPREGSDRSEAERLLGTRLQGSAAPVAVAVAVMLVLAVAVSVDRDAIALLLVLGVVAFLVLRERDRTPAHPVAPTTSPVPPAPTASAATGPPPEWAPAPPPGWPPVPPPPRRRKSLLGRLTLSALLLVLGVAALADTVGAVDVTGTVVLALSLVVVGAGLVLGAWYGRSRGLIALGVALTVALTGVAAVDSAETRAAGSRLWRPVTVADLADGYRLGAGEAVLDLSTVPFEPGRTYVVDAHVGFGRLEVQVPVGVRTVVEGRAGLGEVRLFEVVVGGLGVDQTLTDPPTESSLNPSDISGLAELRLDVSVGFGEVEVRHAAS